MSLINNLKSGSKIGVLGLGYVGLPLAHAFSKQFSVLGIDIDQNKIESYIKGIDVTNEIGTEELKKSNIEFTSNLERIKECSLVIVTVPTPIKIDKTPDLTPIESATKSIGQYMAPQTYIVYESTVFPGVTEDICVPLLEKLSNLKYGEDFFVGYSPERINPGDKKNKVESIVKIVSGMNEKVTMELASIYEKVIKAGIHIAPSIKVAEAAKVLENSQRDINIAFMNEVSLILDKMEIDTFDVLEAMNTKWNALGFYPGLVGGHCIGVDPYYFIYQAEQLGYHSQIISSGRKINDSMSTFITDSLVKKMIKNDMKVKGSNILLFGITFKENTPDVRNSKANDIIKELNEYNVNVFVVDDIADLSKSDQSNFTRIKQTELVEYKNYFDALVYAVDHNIFKEVEYIEQLIHNNGVIIDLKNKFDKKENVWRL
ncbi:nucleotide sugar dehydrogenase [Macrococcoides canis]|uniref:nucleotide sugar dehydrogenase n=1 Tax=Macrococcoides canis TaxID=1855823 RepID=UPI00207C348E|nr:nucleotide sugar dehydrogenase [Macrococcus canis]MCO4096706.1 nucleotide sugar dehydrogenase [Macrococcus canis]UTH10030.1 nucleotide sugar dehydrogenase [Macrococcus canis]